MTFELPTGASACSLHVLAIDADQGSVGNAGFAYLEQVMKLVTVSFPDWYHRMWNDVKMAMKRTGGGSGIVWRTTLQLILVRNISYQPFGSGEWFHELQQALVDYLATRDASDPSFQEALPHLAQRWGLPCRGSADEAAIFDHLADVATFSKKGPCIKLKRFMSIFEGFHFMRHDLHAIKLVLNHLLCLRGTDAEEQGTAVVDESLPTQGVGRAPDYKKELMKAVKDKGTLALAPSLINAKSIAVLDIVLVVGQSAWGAYADRVKEVKLPKQSIEFFASMAVGAWQDELVECIRRSLFDRKNLHSMGVPLAKESHEPFHGVAPFVLDFALCLIDARTLSGIQHSESYPGKFASAMATAPNMADFQQDWKTVLRAEAMALQSETIKDVVAAIRFNEAVAPRLVFMLMERADWDPTDADSKYLLSGLFNRIGDTLVIENIHRDLRRLGKHSQNEIISHSKRMFHTAKAAALRDRKIPMIRVPNEEVARDPFLGERCRRPFANAQ